MDAKTIKEHLKKRLYESALNNVGVTISADDVFKDIAEYRIDIWIDELYKQKEFAESNVQKYDDSLIKTKANSVSEADVIYRQDAIDAFISKYSSLDFMEDGVIELYVETIENLPSAQTEFKIYVVSWIACGVPVVTAFNNYDAAKRCYDAFKTKEGKCLDRVPVYSNFIDYGEIENE